VRSNVRGDQEESGPLTVRPTILPSRQEGHIKAEKSPLPAIPNRAQTLEVLRLMGSFRPLLMLPGDADGYGTRWVLDGQQVPPGIAKYLMNGGFIAETGATGFGARQLTLTDSGKRLCDNGVRWWAGLSVLQRLKITILG